MSIFAGHQGLQLLHKMLNLADKQPYGMTIAAAIRLLAILIEQHRHHGGAICMNQVHKEVDDLLSAFRLIRGETRGSA